MRIIPAVLAMVFAVSAAAEPPREEFPGFSVVPPAGEDWRLATSNEMTLLWMRDTGHPERTFGMAVLAGPSPASIRDRSQLLAFLREVRAGPPPNAELELLRSDLEPAEAPGPACVRHESRIRDRGAQKLTQVSGITCLHPDYPGRMFDVQYSQRAPEDAIDPALDVEGRAFLDSFRFEAAPADDDWSLGEGAATMQRREKT